MSFDVVTPREAFALIKNDKATYIDVRTQQEWDAGHAVNAVHIPMHRLDSKTGDRLLVDDYIDKIVEKFPDKNAKLVIGCASGGRSGITCQKLAQLGYADLSNIDGGFMGKYNPVTGELVIKGWKEEGLPSE